MSIFTTILLTFFGGVLATCMGALGSVILCAFLAIIGVCAVMAGCDYNIVTGIAFGFFFSPHLGLGPAAVALGFAKHQGYVEDSKGIALPLILLGKPSVLAVGGLFGVASYYINLGLSTILPGRLDTVSASIVIIGIICKAIWGNEGVIGKVPQGDKRFGVYSKNNWMPHMPYGEGVTYWLFAGGAGPAGSLAVLGDLRVRQGHEQREHRHRSTVPGLRPGSHLPDPPVHRPALPGLPPCGTGGLLRRQHGLCPGRQ